MTALSRLRPRRGDDAGLSLVEVLVVSVLLTIVGTLVTRAVIDSHKVVRITEDQTGGLADVRGAAERLARDVRDSRSVLCNPAGTPPALVASDPNCARHLQLWVDYNSDYAQQADETVTWRLDETSVAGRYNLVRIVGAGAAQVQSRTIVNNLAFTYGPVQPGAAAPAPGIPTTRVVHVNMIYDALGGTGTTQKSVSFTGRLRNVT